MLIKLIGYSKMTIHQMNRLTGISLTSLRDNIYELRNAGYIVHIRPYYSLSHAGKKTLEFILDMEKLS